MMYEIPVSHHEIQQQSFRLFNMSLKFTLYFNAISNGWQFDLLNQSNDQYITRRCGLAVNSPALITKNLPFVVVLIDDSGLGVNAIDLNELGQRLKIYFIEKEAYRAAIR